MRKNIMTPAFLFTVCALILTLATAFAFKKASQSVCTVKADCPEQVESAAGSEMLWESLSRQFVSSVQL
jgi:hypothetical protein